MSIISVPFFSTIPPTRDSNESSSLAVHCFFFQRIFFLISCVDKNTIAKYSCRILCGPDLPNSRIQPHALFHSKTKYLVRNCVGLRFWQIITQVEILKILRTIYTTKKPLLTIMLIALYVGGLFFSFLKCFFW